MIVIDYSPAMGYCLGRGFDIAKNELKSLIADSLSSSKEKRDEVVIEKNAIDSYKAMERFTSTNIFGESSAFGIGYSLSIDVARSAKITDRNLCIIISASSINLVESLKTSKMSKDSLSAIGDAIDFRNKYGSMYIHSVAYGAKIFASLNIRVDSDEERNSLAAKINSSGLGGELESDFKDFIYNKISGKVESLSIKSLGINLNPVPQTIGELVDVLGEFHELAKKGGTPIFLGLMSINSMSNYNGGGKFAYRQESMGIVCSRYVGYSSLLNTLNLMINGDEMYDMDGVDFRSLIKTKEKVEKTILNIAKIQRKIATGGDFRFDIEDPMLVELEAKLPNTIKILNIKDLSIFPLDLYNGDSEMAGAVGATVQGDCISQVPS